MRLEPQLLGATVVVVVAVVVGGGMVVGLDYFVNRS